ncbi:hypothetical protein ABZ793_18735 [Micromonospora sp. NPDC047465]|uniref:hypothetical protein n=1 Tax=Micromonospora sp. NPDC047465 TaxID=3154813 RepID=UPI0033C3ECF0
MPATAGPEGGPGKPTAAPLQGAPDRPYRYRPLLCFLDNTREALSGLLRRGRAGSTTTADHITVLDAAFAQIPDAHQYGTEIPIQSDSAGCMYGLLTRIRSLPSTA